MDLDESFLVKDLDNPFQKTTRTIPMFGQAEPTNYDVKFTLFKVPVRVHPMFWLFTFLLGYPSFAGERGMAMQFAAIWTIAVFISILVHEFGHVLTGLAFRRRVDEVVLYQFGGYAMVHPAFYRQTVQDILIDVAGPIAGFIVYGLLQLLIQFHLLSGLEGSWQFRLFVVNLLYINLWWGIFNLFPVFPLDGGQAMRHLLSAIAPNGANAAHLLSVIVGGIAAVYFYQQHQAWLTILFAFMVYQNLQIMTAPRY